MPIVVIRMFALLAGLWWLHHAAAAGNGFGSKDPGLLNLRGDLYFLPAGTSQMPKGLEQKKPDGTIYTEQLDIPPRSFRDGFPGVSNRFEWFGLIYNGRFQVDVAGDWSWRLESDDGSRLWIDGKEVIDNDGEHPFGGKEGILHLGPGLHAIKVWYYQGPADELGLQLYVTQPGKEERIFNIADFSSDSKKAAADLGAKATAQGIRIDFDAAVLFDTGRHVLKPAAIHTLRSAATIMATYPQAAVRIHGHTDAIGDEVANQHLSEARAGAVRDALLAAGVPKSLRFEVRGFGKSQPVATNDTEAGRQKNRRVELFIQP